MRIRSTVFVMALAAAAPSAPIAQDNKATDVLAAARKAIGEKKIETLKSLSVEAALQRNINEMQLNSDTELLLDLPARYLRTDSSSGPMNMNVSVGFNGEKAIKPANVQGLRGGGMVIRMGPGGPVSNEKLTPEEQARLDEQMIKGHRNELSRLMLGWFAMTHPTVNAKYTYAGEAESPDGKAHVVDVKNDDGFSARLFIDQQTSLPLMVTYQAPQPRVMMQGGPATRTAQQAHGGAPPREMTEEERAKAREEALKKIQSEPPQMADFTLFFDDWRSVDGVMFPHKIRRAVAGATNEEWTINKVKLNPRIDAKKFEN